MVDAQVHFLLPGQKQSEGGGNAGSWRHVCPHPSRGGEGLVLQKGQALEHLAMCGKAREGLKQMSRVG